MPKKSPFGRHKKQSAGLFSYLPALFVRRVFRPLRRAIQGAPLLEKPRQRNGVPLESFIFYF